MRNRTTWGAIAPLTLVFVLGGVAFAAPGVKGLAGKLKKGIGKNDDKVVQAALEGLLEAGGASAVGELLSLIPKMGGASDVYYWQLVNTAGGFRDRDALGALGDFILKKKKAPYCRDLLFAMENNPSPNVVGPLTKILEKGSYDLQLMAADQLAQVATTRSVTALIDSLKREGDKGDPQLRRRIMAALSTITKENMGDSLNWIGWWDANKNKGLPEPEEPAGGGGNVVSSMNRDRGKQIESVKRQPKRILVISSMDPKRPGSVNDYDSMEKMLEEMEIPHVVVLKDAFQKDPKKYLERAWTVLINCNNIQSTCICPECASINQKRKEKGQSIGPKINRLNSCPPDCPKGHNSVSNKMSEEGVQALKRWTEQGGYLFTEDWGIVEILDRAWPKVLSSHQEKSKDRAGNEASGPKLVHVQDAKDAGFKIVRGPPPHAQQGFEVPIVPGRGMTSRPLLRGVFTRPRPPARESDADADGGDGGSRTRDLPPTENPTSSIKHQWQIDDESPSIFVQNGGKVEILMRSQQLGKLAGGDDAVAVNFRVGNSKPKSQTKKGRKGPVTGGGRLSGKSRGKGHWSEGLRGGSVLHVISHFGHQQGSKSDTFVLQNLILNFIMESNRQHGGF